jgi:hypothetical protein
MGSRFGAIVRCHLSANWKRGIEPCRRCDTVPEDHVRRECRIGTPRSHELELIIQ